MTDALTRYENDTIRAFVEKAAADGYLKGRVLDYGCGKQPYRDLVQGEYIPFDRAHFPANQSGDVGEEPWRNLPTPFDTILCTQVMQYAPWPQDLLRAFKLHGKVLVMTYPTNWPEVQDVDLWRFTKAGMARLLTTTGFAVVRHERRGSVYDPAFPSGRQKRITATGLELALGYGVVARA